MPKNTILLVWVLAAAARPQVVCPEEAGAAHAEEMRAPVPLAARIPRERLEDPPGERALPTPGARPVVPVGIAGFMSVQVNVDSAGANITGDAANEPSIAVDPTNPNHMAIGWRQFDTTASNFREAGIAYSKDGGRSWTFPGVLDPGVFRSDPVLGTDASGNFYYNSLKLIGSVITGDIFISLDDGVSWGPPVPAHGGDKEWMAIDRSGGLGDGHIYSWWSIAGSCCGSNTFTRSVNGGVSYETPIAIPSTPVWGVMDVAPDGTVWLAGININNSSTFYVSHSTNARDPMETPAFSTQTVNLGGSLESFGGIGSPNPEGLLGQVQIVVDPTPSLVGEQIYVLCSVNPPGPDPLDVHFIRSTDGGTTWSTPIRVNDDPANADAWQWLATMSVSAEGRIDVVWNDTRATLDPTISELYYAYSDDGGVTWAANQPASIPWGSHVGWPNQSKIGDYYHMVSDLVGSDLAWAATFNGEQDVYYLRIGARDCNTNGIADSLDIALGTSYDQNGNGIPDECEPGATAVSLGPSHGYALYQNVPNPFNPSTTIRFELPAEQKVRLDVFDVQGRHVRTLLDGTAVKGNNVSVWDGSDESGRRVASGVYFYRLRTAEFTRTHKMVVLK